MSTEHAVEERKKTIVAPATVEESSSADAVRSALGLMGGLGVLALAGCNDSSTDTATAAPVDPHANCTDHDAARCMGGGSGSPAPTPPTGSPGTTPTPAPVSTVGPRTFAILGTGAVAVTVANGSHAGHPVWYFAGNGTAGNGFSGNRVLPSPVIEGAQGQNMSITLTSMMPHTLHPHGLDVDQANDGVADTSGFVGVRPMMGNFGRLPAGAVSLGTTFTYSFTAPFAGTYMYHCHVDTVLHMEMGLYGIVIVRPPNGSLNQAWANGPTFDKEYVWVLHTMDSTWHALGMMPVSGSRTVRYRPNVFMINGMTGAALAGDTTVAISGTANSRVLVRLANPGYLPAVVEFGGLPFSVIASDGRPLPAAISASTYTVMPGERFDVILTLPANAGTRNATVTYQNIRGTGNWGSASTTVTTA